MSKRFFESFPPPVFLTMPHVGLSIESDAIRIVSFQSQHGLLTLKMAEELKLDPGTIVAGELVKPDRLARVFETLREHGVHFVRVTVPEEKAYVFESVQPLPDEGDVAEAIEFSLDQNIPLKATEAVFDYAVVEGPFAGADGVQSVRSVVSAYPNENAEIICELLKQAGITPIGMMQESAALALAVVPAGDMRTVLVVHFAKDKTIIAVVSKGFVRFATVVASTLENAEKVLASHEGEKIAESVELLAVRDEVKKVYGYWMSKQHIKSVKDALSVKSVIVTGHVSNMSDVAEYLGTHVGVPAFLGNVWQNAFSLDTYVPSVEFEQSLAYALAVGAALPTFSTEVAPEK